MLYSGAFFFIGFLLFINSLLYVWRFHAAKSLIIGYLLLFLGVLSLYYGLTISKYIVHAPYLFGSYALICSFIHLLYILLIIYYIERDLKWDKKYLALLIFPLIQAILFIPYLKLPEDVQIQIIEATLQRGHFHYYHSSMSFYVNILNMIGMYLFALIYIGKRFKWGNVTDKYKAKVRITLAIVYVSILAFIILDFLSIFEYNDVSTSSALQRLLEFTLVLVFFLFFQMWPFLFRYGLVPFDPVTFKVEKYFTRYLGSIDVEEIGNSLNHLIQIEKLHMDEESNLTSMAKSLGITAHQFSAYLNQHLQQSFSDFINEKRIYEAKEILQHDPEKNVLEICYEIGYNSPATFYKAFKKETGLAPKEWKNKKII